MNYVTFVCGVTDFRKIKAPFTTSFFTVLYFSTELKLVLDAIRV